MDVSWLQSTSRNRMGENIRHILTQIENGESCKIPANSLCIRTHTHTHTNPQREKEKENEKRSSALATTLWQLQRSTNVSVYLVVSVFVCAVQLLEVMCKDAFIYREKKPSTTQSILFSFLCVLVQSTAELQSNRQIHI